MGLAMLSLQYLQAQDCAHYKNMFWAQMAGTCAPGLRWQKSVTEIAENGGETTETKTLDLDCYSGFAKDATTTIPLDPAEFGHLFEYAFDNPYVSDKLDIVRVAQGVTATAKPDQIADSKLHLQRFETDATTGKLRVAEAKIVKGSALYDLQVHITVWFDAAGRYERHAVETTTDVLLGGSVHTRILAQLIP
jgi:hypothetical protein